jgi:hypothetical protein
MWDVNFYNWKRKGKKGGFFRILGDNTVKWNLEPLSRCWWNKLKKAFLITSRNIWCELVIMLNLRFWSMIMAFWLGKNFSSVRFWNTGMWNSIKSGICLKILEKSGGERLANIEAGGSLYWILFFSIPKVFHNFFLQIIFLNAELFTSTAKLSAQVYLQLVSISMSNLSNEYK